MLHTIAVMIGPGMSMWPKLADESQPWLFCWHPREGDPFTLLVVKLIGSKPGAIIDHLVTTEGQYAWWWNQHREKQHGKMLVLKPISWLLCYIKKTLPIWLKPVCVQFLGLEWNEKLLIIRTLLLFYLLEWIPYNRPFLIFALPSGSHRRHPFPLS